MKPIHKNKIRAIELIAFSIAIPLLMYCSFQVGRFYETAHQIISEPVRENLMVGQQADTHGGLAEIEATIYAYTSDPNETDSDPCMSASGVNLCEHYPPDFFNGFSVGGCSFGGYGLMACPKEYPFGTKVVLDELGSQIDVDGKDYDYICVDRMNQEKHPNGFDIYMGQGEEAKQKAKEWGVRRLPIKIYK